MTDSTPLESTAWIGAKGFSDEYLQRIQQCNESINSDALLSYASSLRNIRPCALSRGLSVGRFNLVRKIKFDDGVQWVARLQLPPLPDDEDPPPPAKLRREMESELDTMEFVR